MTKQSGSKTSASPQEPASRRLQGQTGAWAWAWAPIRGRGRPRTPGDRRPDRPGPRPAHLTRCAAPCAPGSGSRTSAPRLWPRALT